MPMRAPKFVIQKHDAFIVVAVSVSSHVALSATSKTPVEPHGLRLVACRPSLEEGHPVDTKEVILILRRLTI
jgi:hypothetical protein